METLSELKQLEGQMESLKEKVKAYAAGNQAIIDGRVAEAVSAAKVAIQADLEAAGQRGGEAEKRADELMAGVKSAVSEMKADADEMASAVAVSAPAASEPAPSAAPAEAAGEGVSEPGVGG